MTIGEIMFYGGIAGTAISLLTVVIALRVFAKRRKKMLKKIMESLLA